MKTLFFLLMVSLLTACSSNQKKQEIRSEEEIASECNFPQFQAEISSYIWNADDTLVDLIKDNKIDKNSRGIFCRTMTHEAVKNHKFLSKLIDAGVPFDEKDSMGDSPIVEAVFSKNLDSMEILLKKGVKTNQKHSFDNTLFFHTLEHFPNGIDLLIKYNVCPLGTGFMDKTLESIIEHYSFDFQEKIINYKKNYSLKHSNCFDNVLKKD